MKDDSIEKLIAVLITSAIGGALIGLLMKPKKELSTRDKVTQEGDKYLGEVSDTIDEIRRFVNKKKDAAKADVDATKADFDELSEDAKGKGEALLKRAKKLLSYKK